MVKEWVMNQDDFDRFLAWLDPDREEAGKKYEKIRRRIITICRAHSIPEIDAEEIFDEIINRVVRKLPEIIDTYNGDPALYFYGVARNVIRERWHPIKPPVPPSSLDDPNYKERCDRCLEHCLRQIGQD